MSIEKQRYLWIRHGSDDMIIIDDPVELFRGSKFDEDNDKLYEIGREVELKVSVQVKGKTVYREDGSVLAKRSTMPKDQEDLGVGEYRG